ncbi:conserved hypothetical protein [Coccidioides posadasii str. Silveira]|uniref:Uncharacterized protein n=1 Tax=Coccidioides posadasii (strain RMSCC 757 / Silveira) TaxID=443226 RepID=E9D940_COCPS|nr:conserved hypothetical protein [Coccidioides posadasii str. Silveira]
MCNNAALTTRGIATPSCTIIRVASCRLSAPIKQFGPRFGPIAKWNGSPSRLLSHQRQLTCSPQERRTGKKPTRFDRRKLLLNCLTNSKSPTHHQVCDSLQNLKEPSRKIRAHIKIILSTQEKIELISRRFRRFTFVPVRSALTSDPESLESVTSVYPSRTEIQTISAFSSLQPRATRGSFQRTRREPLPKYSFKEHPTRARCSIS